MIHGSTSFNFCWSTNVEHCCAVYHSNFKNKASSWKRQGNSQLMKREKSWRQQAAWQTIAWTSKDLLTRCSEFCCNLSFHDFCDPSILHRTGTEKSCTDWSVDWCYQNSNGTLLLPTLQLPCWYFQETTWHQTRKRSVEAFQQAATCWTE